MELAKAKKCKIIFAGKPNHVPSEQDIIQSITKKTKIIAYANISNLLGYELNANIIGAGVKKHNLNLFVVCDATQMLPHKLIDVKKANVDFLVASAHKMCAGTGIGMLYMKEKYFNMINPIRFGGGMNNNVECNSYTFASGPDKFEGGSPHTAGIVS
jgi:cysteine desulfurase/selenocysteine lyase